MYLLTATLLNSWRYLLNNEYSTEEDFLRTLRREKFEPTEAIQKGFAFEAWACANIAELKNARLQVKLSKTDGQTVFYGVIDALTGDTVIDTKFTSSYEVGKFRSNYQTPMYLYLSDAKIMKYFVSTKEEPKGHELYIETYTAQDVEPIQKTRDTFYDWLKTCGLWGIYTEFWKSKY